MRIILANPRGFCAGVNIAVEVVNRVLKLKGSPIYVYHEIVHNRHVVEDLRGRGVTFVDDIEAVPDGSVLVYSAHGVSPRVRAAARRRSLIEVDATCPLVAKVHLEVLRFAREGYTILFVGHRGHDEAVGTTEEAPEHVILVERPEDVESLALPDGAKVAYVTQTTLSVADAQRTIAAIRRKWPAAVGPKKDDICYATTNRQNAVSVLSGEAELVIVIGSQNSSNSMRLVETAKAAGRQAYLVDDEGELRSEWFDGKRAVLVTAGASAPEDVVRRLVERLEREFAGVLEERTLVEENVSFAMPASLRVLDGR